VDPDPGGPKICGSGGSGSATLVPRKKYVAKKGKGTVPYLSKSPKMINIEIFFLRIRNRIRILNSEFMDPS
jgi:hypothetical protein